jgi:hypothetical protein
MVLCYRDIVDVGFTMELLKSVRSCHFWRPSEHWIAGIASMCIYIKSLLVNVDAQLMIMKAPFGVITEDVERFFSGYTLDSNYPIKFLRL